MSRINQNISSMVAQRTLGSQNMGLNKSLERLSTGLRINRGSDDPAGLIASENLRSEKAAINAAINNAERAEQVVNVAEGGLQEVSNLLIELQSLVSSTANEAGVSSEEKSANQLRSIRSCRPSTELPTPRRSRAKSCSTATLTTRLRASIPLN